MRLGRLLAIALILLGGAVLGALILRTEPGGRTAASRESNEHGHDGEHANHDEQAEHAEHADHADDDEEAEHADHAEHDEHEKHAGRDDHVGRGERDAGRIERVALAPDVAARAGIAVETAGPATLATRLRLHGLIAPNEDRLAHVLPRFAGIVKDVRKHIGDPVAKGEVLAIVQSNQSLQAYDVRSEIAGNVIQKHVAPGEFVSEGDHLYTVANLDTVWIDLNVYRQDFPRLAVGQPVLVDPGEGIAPIAGRVDYISPFGAPNTQTMLARVVLANPRHLLRPGFFVSGDVLVDQAVVPLAVRASAVQTLNDRQVVFVQKGDVYAARPVDLGRRDGEWIEVLSGLAPGERYVTANSFVLKADVGKSAADHDH